MKIVKIILLSIVILVVIAAVAGLFMPSKFSYDQTMAMNADQKAIFDQVNILKNWEQWSPWYKMDLETKLTYDGPESGVGASYSWISSKTGEGILTISESVPYESVISELDFKDNGKAIAGFKISKSGTGNNVTWWFESDLGGNPFKKLFFGLFGSKIIGESFTQGLTDIKKIVESLPAASPESISSAPETIDADTVN